MELNLKKLGILIFILTTLALTIATAFTWRIYFGTIKAIRNFTITVQNLNLEVLNITSATIEMALPIQNPSEYLLKTFYVNTYVTLNGEFILNHGLDMWATPTDVPPESTVTLTIKSIITDPNKIQFINAQSRKVWGINILTWIEAPLVGKLYLTFRERLTQ